MSATTTATATGIGLAGAHVLAETSTSGNDANAPTVSVQVNWNGDGSTYVEEQTHVRGVSVRRGRTAVNDSFGAGAAVIRLRNQDGRYSPFNPLSPLYGQVVGGRAVKVVASYRGISYPLWAGTIMEPAQDTLLSKAEVSLSCIDAFERFRLAQDVADLQTSQRVDQIIAAILAANGWTGGTTLEAGRTLALYAQPVGNVLQALQNAAFQEAGGALFMGADGTVTFQNAAHRANAPVYQVLASVEKMTLSARQSDLYDLIEVTYDTFTWGDAGQSAYSGQQGLPLYPGQNTITDTYSAIGVTNVTTPVQGTDYTCSDQPTVTPDPPAGTSSQPYRAVDVTRNVGVDSFTTTGTSFTLVLYNALPYVVYLSKLQIRATAQQSQSNPRRFTLTPPGVVLGTAQTLRKTFDWVSDDAVIAAWAQQRALALSRQHARPVITLVGKTPALMHTILGADLSARIALQDVGGIPGAANQMQSALPYLTSPAVAASAPWLSGLAGQFFIENMQLEITPGKVVTAQWQLFDTVQGAV